MAAALLGAVRLMERLSPELAARAAEPLFLSPRRHGRPAHEQAAFATAERSNVHHRGKRVPVYSWGQGPVVLFAHGWEGRGSQVAPLLGPLVASGFRVVSYDMLAHGEAPRTLVSVVDFAEVALSVASSLGDELHAAIGHSVGGTALVVASARAAFTDRLVVLGAPLHPRRFLGQFADLLALAPATRAALSARLDARYGLHFEGLDTRASAAALRARALVLHDRGDREVPFSHGERLAAALPGATFHATEGLGHRRILRDPDVVQRVVAFVEEAPRQRSLGERVADELYERELRVRVAS